MDDAYVDLLSVDQSAIRPLPSALDITIPDSEISDQCVTSSTPAHYPQALLSLGLSHSLGFLRVVQLPHATPTYTTTPPAHAPTQSVPSSSNSQHQPQHSGSSGSSLHRERSGSLTSPNKHALETSSLARSDSQGPALTDSMADGTGQCGLITQEGCNHRYRIEECETELSPEKLHLLRVWEAVIP